MDTKFDDLRSEYFPKFSLNYLGKDIQRKFALISLICYVTNTLKEKNQLVTHLGVIKKISAELHLPDDFIYALAIICEDFSYGCTNFPTFNLKSSEMVKTIKEILSDYVPF